MNSLGASGNGFDFGGRGPSDAIAYPNIHQVFGDKAGDSINKIKSNLQSWASSQADSALSAEALEQIYQVQSSMIIDHNGELYRGTEYRSPLTCDCYSTCGGVVLRFWFP